MKKALRIALFIVVVVVSTVLEIELVLYLTDPWGVKYFDDVATIWDKVVESPTRGYVLPPGTYQFSHWTATQLQNSVRYLPDNANGPCKVVFLGDSVEYGHGVNDNETWVNLIAKQLPQVNAINASFDVYNSENVRRGIADFPDAQVIVYLVNGNDTDATFGYEQGWPTQPHLSMIEKYIRFYLLNKGVGDSAIVNGPDAEQLKAGTIRFDNDIQQISQDKRVVMIAFEKAFDKAFVTKYNIHEIPLYKNRISLADIHPNAAGNKEVAASALPIVRDAGAQLCSK